MDSWLQGLHEVAVDGFLPRFLDVLRVVHMLQIQNFELQSPASITMFSPCVCVRVSALWERNAAFPEDLKKRFRRELTSERALRYP